MTLRRPIDARRDSAKSGRVGGSDDNSAITDMIPLGDKMCVIKERSIYAMQLADQIDPQRTNEALPDIQQKILPVGSSDPIVARIFLTAHTLFDKKFLGAAFDQDKAKELALDILKDIVALGAMRAGLEAAEASARADYEARTPGHSAVLLPSLGNAEARCDAFAQKAGHVVNTMAKIAKLFYGQELTSKWIDSLVALTARLHGEASPFTQYMKGARPFLLLVRDLRNMIEHPTEDKYVKVNDFRMQASGHIAPPNVEIVRPGEDAATATIALLMAQITDDLVSVAEVLTAHLCGAHVQPFAGIPVQVVELPADQRGSNKHQRFFYGCYNGDQIIRVG